MDFLAVFVASISLFFCAFLLSFPGILRFRQENPVSVFGGFPCFAQKKSKDWRVREVKRPES